MPDIRIEWNHDGFNEILSGGPVVAMIGEFGAKYTAKANATLRTPGGYKGAPHVVGRAIFNVYTFSSEAKHDNSARNTLAKLMP